MSGTRPNREEVARLELGHTEVTPALAKVVVAVFLATAALPASLQFALDRSAASPGSANSGEPERQPGSAPAVGGGLPSGSSTGGRWRSLADLAARIPSGRALRQFEDRLNEASLATRTLAPGVGSVIKGLLRGGDEQAYFGREGWLFYRPSVDSITGPGFLTSRWQRERMRSANSSLPPPQPDPVQALTQFHGQLAARGIALLLVPTPGKESVQPGKLTSRCDASPTMVQNPSFERFKSELAKVGVRVFDPAPVLSGLNRRSGQDVYLKTDTHWSASAMEAVAGELADWVQDGGLVPAPGPGKWRTWPQAVTNFGDLTVMLNLPPGQRFFPSETVSLHRVATAEGRSWEPDESAPVLLMGDSFCNIYSLAEMGWGDSAGFAEHLSLALGQPLDRIVINAGGAWSARQELARELVSGRDRLAGKRLVIYQFAARELAFGDWKLLDLPAASAPTREAASRSGERIVRGRVAAVARLPRPGSVPYKDCLVAIRLSQVREETPGAAETDLLIYALGMRDNRWLPVSSVTVGTEVRCRLQDWSQVEKRYGGLNRAELDDLDLLSLPTFWAEEVAR